MIEFVTDNRVGKPRCRFVREREMYSATLMDLAVPAAVVVEMSSSPYVYLAFINENKLTFS